MMASQSAVDRCRCCRTTSAASYRDLTVEYESPNDHKLYADMLKECFGVVLSHLESSRLICESCVNSLKVSCNFKQLVLKSEEYFFEELECGVVEAETKPCHIMLESVKKGNSSVRQSDICQSDSDDSWGAGDPCDTMEGNTAKLKPVTRSSFSGDEVISLSKLVSRKTSSKRIVVVGKETTSKSEPKKLNLNFDIPRKPRVTKIIMPTSFKNISIKPKTYNLQPIQLASSDEPRPFRQNNHEDMMESNAANIIKYSNVCPFKCAHNEYACFYCGKQFCEPLLLRDHTAEHGTERLQGLLRYDCLVKIDITDLNCKLCSESITDLNRLKKHLSEKHEKVFYDGVGYDVLPFRLSKDDIHCAVCSEMFTTFHAVNQHMNEHYPNYVCEQCGLGFVDPSRLRVHKAKHESNRKHNCHICQKVFKSKYACKCHIDRMHNKSGRIYCPLCPEKFLTYYRKLSHMTTVHGKEPEAFMCTHCNKKFTSRNHLTVHTRKKHLNDYRYVCAFCGKKFFTKTTLVNHTPTHTGERNYKCEVCGNGYPREKALQVHMRIHNNDRRFTCSTCGQAFIQKCSLNGHIKSHHPEYSGL